VDRAALDAALELGIPAGGWCPRGRRAEDGRIDDRYPLREIDSPYYSERTEKNVLEADGTLILSWGKPKGGTGLTIELAQIHNKPFLVIDLSSEDDPFTVLNWGRKEKVQVLNVAGPRESENPGIYAQALAFLKQILLSSKG
jgi:hypothetical protein